MESNSALRKTFCYLEVTIMSVTKRDGIFAAVGFGVGVIFDRLTIFVYDKVKKPEEKDDSKKE